MEAVSASETFLPIYQVTRRHIIEDAFFIAMSKRTSNFKTIKSPPSTRLCNGVMLYPGVLKAHPHICSVRKNVCIMIAFTGTRFLTITCVCYTAASIVTCSNGSGLLLAIWDNTLITFFCRRYRLGLWALLDLLIIICLRLMIAWRFMQMADLLQRNYFHWQLLTMLFSNWKCFVMLNDL
jgi:hypothetical protein